jgi:hypothetical protein
LRLGVWGLRENENEEEEKEVMISIVMVLLDRKRGLFFPFFLFSPTQFY